MLNSTDLRAIGALVEKIIDRKLEQKLDQKLDEKLLPIRREMSEGFAFIMRELKYIKGRLEDEVFSHENAKG